MDFKLLDELLDAVNMRYLDMGIKYEVTSNSGIFALVKYMCNNSTSEKVTLLSSRYLSDVTSFLGHVLDSISTLSFLSLKGYFCDKDRRPYIVCLGGKQLGCYHAESFCVACVKALADESIIIDGDTTPVEKRKLKIVLPELTYNGLKFHNM